MQFRLCAVSVAVLPLSKLLKQARQRLQACSTAPLLAATSTVLLMFRNAQCNELRGVQPDSHPGMECKPELVFDGNDWATPPPDFPVGMSLNHIKFAKQASLRMEAWYERQMSGTLSAAERQTLVPLQLVGAERNPLEKLMSHFGFFVYRTLNDKDKASTTFGSWLDNLKGRLPTQLNLFGISDASGFQQWWGTGGKKVLWLTLDRFNVSLAVLLHTVGLEAWEMATVPTQPSTASMTGPGGAAMDAAAVAAVMALTPPQQERLRRLLEPDFLFYEAATEALKKRVAAIIAEVGNVSWDASITQQCQLAAYLQSACQVTGAGQYTQLVDVSTLSHPAVCVSLSSPVMNWLEDVDLMGRYAGDKGQAEADERPAVLANARHAAYTAVASEGE